MLSEIFFILRRIQLDIFIKLHRSLRLLIKLQFFSTDFQKPLNIKCNENPTNESCVVTCGHTEEQMDGQRDIMKLLVFFTIFSQNAREQNIHARCLSYFTLICSWNEKRLSVSP